MNSLQEWELTKSTLNLQLPSRLMKGAEISSPAIGR